MRVPMALMAAGMRNGGCPGTALLLTESRFQACLLGNTFYVFSFHHGNVFSSYYLYCNLVWTKSTVQATVKSQMTENRIRYQI
jgi:hypothetical protein